MIMLHRIRLFLERQPTWVILLGSLLLLLLVGYLDVITGPELTFAHFYLVPVCLVTWFRGSRWGYFMAFASAGVCLWAEYMGAAFYMSPLLREWNLLTRLAFFISSVWLLSYWRSIGVRLAAMVDERTAELRQEISRRQSAQNDLRVLAGQLSAAEDAERRKLAHEIHDSLGQLLSLMKINLDAAVLEAPDESPLQSRLTECASTTDDLIRQVRTLTFDLHPPMLDDLGLVATLERFARNFKRTANVDLIVQENGVRRPVGAPLINYLFRAIKELVANALKHGQASEIIISVYYESSNLRIVIDDDGCGFDVNAALDPTLRRGLGLPGIDERMASLGGRLKLESTIGEGSRCILEVPLRLDLQKEHAYGNASSLS